MNPIETTHHHEVRIHIRYDAAPLHPIKDMDNFGRMVLFHRRYDLGIDMKERESYERDPQEFKEWLHAHRDEVIALPVSMYEHGNVILKVGRPTDPWDSGMVGYIYVTKASAREQMMTSRLTRGIMETVLNNLRIEVDVYSRYLNGEVYGYKVMTLSRMLDKGEKIEALPDSAFEESDSCWGFYGLDDVRTAAHDAADFAWNEMERERVNLMQRLENVTKG